MSDRRATNPSDMRRDSVSAVTTISLIGVRGCGKSNVSRRLAAATKRPLLSTDVLIQYDNSGHDIASLAGDGWGKFRDLEFAVVAKAVAVPDAIIDCGGGVIVDIDANGAEVFSERKVGRLRQAGTVIWLDGDLERLAAKATIPTPNRPTLGDVSATTAIMRARLPHYERAADIRIDIEGKPRRQIAFEICHAVAEFAPFADAFTAGQDIPGS